MLLWDETFTYFYLFYLASLAVWKVNMYTTFTDIFCDQNLIVTCGVTNIFMLYQNNPAYS